MRLGQLMLGLEGTALSALEREWLKLPQVGGVILFERNFRSAEQLAGLTAEIHAMRSPSLVIAVDQEGGRVQRFREPFTRLPPAASLGRLYDRDPELASESARKVGWLMASELLSVGVDHSFAPVLDLDRGISSVIGDRALHRDPEVVAQLGACWIRGMHEAGMAATGKHFPGHGAVAPDSHRELPIDNRPELELRDSDMRPFETLIGQGLLDALMTAHVAYPEADIQPASFSAHWVSTVLREDMGFDGAVIADDLGMEGAAAIGDLPARARVALEAGCDLVMLCNLLEATPDVLAALPDEPPADSARRIEGLRGRGVHGDLRSLRKSSEWRQARAAIEALI